MSTGCIIVWLVLGLAGGWYAACSDRAWSLAMKPELAPGLGLALFYVVLSVPMGPFAFVLARWIYRSECTFLWRRKP